MLARALVRLVAPTEDVIFGPLAPWINNDISFDADTVVAALLEE